MSHIESLTTWAFLVIMGSMLEQNPLPLGRYISNLENNERIRRAGYLRAAADNVQDGDSAGEQRELGGAEQSFSHLQRLTRTEEQFEDYQKKVEGDVRGWFAKRGVQIPQGNRIILAIYSEPADVGPEDIDLPRVDLAVDELDRAVWEIRRNLGNIAAFEHVGQRKLNAPIERLGLHVRPYNCLKIGRMSTVRNILGRTEDDLFSLRNFGERCLYLTLSSLAVHGFIPNSPPEPEAKKPELPQ